MSKTIINLLSLKLTNFKGIKSFELKANGQNTSVFGDNATGKTTLVDAFVWLLFNKDSQNKTDFEIKTLVDGKPIHKLDHEVEATLLVNNKELTLKKVYKEKWTKKRGSVSDEFTGHSTDYYVNEVPVKKSEFDQTISDLVNEDVFKLLTNPSYFNEKIHWKERRDLLLEIAGDITDEDVIASNKDLAKLLDVLNGNSIDDHKKIIAAKRKKINEELDIIPVRIDEIHRGLTDLSGLNEKTIKDTIQTLTAQIDEKNEQINSIRNGSEVNELKKQISDIELKISNVRNEHTQNEQQELFKLKAKLQEEQSNHTILQGEVKGLLLQQKTNEQLISSKQDQMKSLREEYQESQAVYETINASEFDHENECVCPTCEQSLPQEQITEASTKFNLNKSKELEKIIDRQKDINVKGKGLKGEVEEIQHENEEFQKKIDKIIEQGKAKVTAIEKIEEKIKQAELVVKPVEENDQYIQLVEQKKALEQQIDQLNQSVEESISKVRVEIEKLKEQLAKSQADLSSIEVSKRSKERILELEEQSKKLAKEFEELEHQLYLAEEFTRTKVNMLTEKINSKFKYARFNLFKENINGGLEEICETTFDGVPYSSGLNNAARINVGLDIINTLSTHYGVQAPIFIDNAESVTSLIDIDSQLISLVVSEKDKELRVETDSAKESEVA